MKAKVDLGQGGSIVFKTDKSQLGYFIRIVRDILWQKSAKEMRA